MTSYLRSAERTREVVANLQAVPEFEKISTYNVTVFLTKVFKRMPFT